VRNATVTEAGLTDAAREGDADAFGRLVLGHAVTARRVAYGVLGSWDDADDVVQDAAFAAWQAMSRFETHRAFRPWFLRIVANAALDQLRRRRVRQAEPLAESLAAGTPGPDQATERSLLKTRIDQALAALPERQRVAVMMFDREGFSHAEIATVLQVPEGTVRSYVFHARRALRRALTSLVEEPA
jgi:RNA polymerase sigma-70 factor (ECF subfamily)